LRHTPERSCYVRQREPPWRKRLRVRVWEPALPFPRLRSSGWSVAAEP